VLSGTKQSLDAPGEQVCHPASSTWPSVYTLTLSITRTSRTVFYRHRFLQTPFSTDTVFYRHRFLQTPFSTDTVFYRHHFLQTPFSTDTIFYRHHFLQTPLLFFFLFLFFFLTTPFSTDTVFYRHLPRSVYRHIAGHWYKARISHVCIRRWVWRVLRLNLGLSLSYIYLQFKTWDLASAYHHQLDER
jgi:hypothetical protein